jgi:hypothetical protein
MAWSVLRRNLPWLVDCAGCLVMDLFILGQFTWLRRRARRGAASTGRRFPLEGVDEPLLMANGALAGGSSICLSGLRAPVRMRGRERRHSMRGCWLDSICRGGAIDSNTCPFFWLELPLTNGRGGGQDGAALSTYQTGRGAIGSRPSCPCNCLETDRHISYVSAMAPVQFFGDR